MGAAILKDGGSLGAAILDTTAPSLGAAILGHVTWSCLGFPRLFHNQ